MALMWIQIDETGTAGLDHMSETQSDRLHPWRVSRAGTRTHGILTLIVYLLQEPTIHTIETVGLMTSTTDTTLHHPQAGRTILTTPMAATDLLHRLVPMRAIIRHHRVMATGRLRQDMDILRLATRRRMVTVRHVMITHHHTLTHRRMAIHPLPTSMDRHLLATVLRRPLSETRTLQVARDLGKAGMGKVAARARRVAKRGRRVAERRERGTHPQTEMVGM
mmetsp:Transcript_29473/g.53505  ORF Transcript_29473/g.53505 Transcript_29473/m.53505 type:complete len:221 (+) Transcript_29473:84-746(+)